MDHQTFDPFARARRRTAALCAANSAHQAARACLGAVLREHDHHPWAGDAAVPQLFWLAWLTDPAANTDAGGRVMGAKYDPAMTTAVLHATMLAHDWSCGQALLHIGQQAQALRYDGGHRDAAPSGPDSGTARIAGLALRTEGWIAPPPPPGTTDFQASQHPDRVEVRLLAAVMRDGLTWSSTRTRGTQLDHEQHLIATLPESDTGPSGPVLRGLAMLLDAFVSTPVPVPPLFRP